MQYTNAPAGLVYPGDPGYPGKSVTFARWRNLALRVGIVVNFGTYENFLLRFKTPNSQQWNLSIQRQVASDWLLQVGYVGNAFTHLLGGNQANPGVYIPGSCVINGVETNPCSTVANVNLRRRRYLQNPTDGRYFGIVHQLDAGGTSTYHGLVLSVQKRISKGYSVQAVYTWAHCISDLNTLELGGGGRLFMIPDNRTADRSNCPGADRRHNFNFSSVYETPKFANSTFRVIASDWQISSIIRLTTGPYITVLSGLGQARTGQTAYERPNQVLPYPYSPNRTFANCSNPAAFAQPAIGTYGNLGNYNVLAPGAITINMGMSRTVPIRERYSLQFRVEALNVANHVNPGTPTGVSGFTGLSTPTVNLNNPLFGRILSADDPRIWQGALKFVF